MSGVEVRALSVEDEDAADREGWAVFECWGSDNGPWQIQSFDFDREEWAERTGRNRYPFDDDAGAWVHVFGRAIGGSPMHCRAMAFLYEENRTEFDAIVKWCSDVAKGVSA